MEDVATSEFLFLLFPHIKNARALGGEKTQRKRRKKHYPDISASVPINLLLTAFNVISSHMFLTRLCLRPLKTNSFISELFTPSRTGAEPRARTQPWNGDDSSPALSLKDVTLSFHEGHSGAGDGERESGGGVTRRFLDFVATSASGRDKGSGVSALGPRMCLV